MNQTTYTLTVTEDQLQLIRDATELFARLHMGQIEEVVQMALMRISHVYRDDTEANNRATMDAQDCDEGLRALKRLLYGLPGSGSFYSILNKEQVPDSARVAMDMYQVTRYRLAWDRHIAAGGDPNKRPTIQVHYDKPRGFSDEPLPEVSKLPEEKS